MVRTVVTREPEWDDLERDKMFAITRYQVEICDCGLHPSVADEDPSLELAVRICPVCAGLAQQQRVLASKDDAAAKARGDKSPPATPRPEDGRHVGIRPKPVPPEASRRS